MKLLKNVFLSAVLFLPVITFAHVKWFSEKKELVRPYSFGDEFVICWVLAVVVFVLVGVFLERKVSLPINVLEKFKKISPLVHSLAQIGFGFSLIIFSIKGFIFAPNLALGGEIGLALRLLEFISGVMITLGYYERLGAVTVLFVYFYCMYFKGAIEMLDALEIFGFGLYLLIYGRPGFKISSKVGVQNFQLDEYAIPVLRIFTGLNLIVLGFSEKILNPSLTQNFLQNYHWNFMETLGFHSFTDYWFAFSAGVVESLFGLFLVLGLVTRLTTLALAVFLIVTLCLLGPVELMGHLPHFSIAIIFLVLGGGVRLKLR